MPPLNKEVLRQISTGEMSDRLKFVRFKLGTWDMKNLTDRGRPTALTTFGQIVYYTGEESGHQILIGELQRDIEAGRLPLPAGIGWAEEDAGRMRRIKNSGVLFYGYSSSMKHVDDPIAREETGRFVQEEVAEPDVSVEYEIEA